VNIMQHSTRLVLSVVGASLAVAVAAPAGATTVDPGPIPPPVPVDLTRIYVTDNSPPDWPVNGMVLRVNKVTGDRTLVSDNHVPIGGPDFQAPMGVTFDATGNLLVAEAFEIDINGVHTPAVIRVDPSTGVRTLVSSNSAPAGGPDLVAPYGIAVEADGNILVADPGAFASGNGGIIRVDPVTGARTILSRNQAPVGGPSFDSPIDVAVAPNGDIFVIDRNGVIRVDKVTGARTQVSANGAPNGAPNFVSSSRLTLDTNGDILVSDWGSNGNGRIIRVNPVTGVRSWVSRNSAPVGGPSFGLLGDLVVVCGSILVVDISNGAVLSVNPTTGARTTVSDNTMSASLPAFGYPFGIAATNPGCAIRA
jgi:hypothetical protein